MSISNVRLLPQYHSCGTILEEKGIKVNPKILSLNPYSVNYCPKCCIYKFNHYESQNPKDIARYIEALQLRTKGRG